MTDEFTYPMRDGAPTGSPGRYDLATIVKYLKSSDPGAVTSEGQAYLRFAKAYEQLTAKLAQVGHEMNEAWTGTDASAAQEHLRNLWASSHTIGAASKDFGTAVERHGSEYLAWYKNNMPQPKDDAEARSWMQGANERITETWTAIPPAISTPLYQRRGEHGGLISTPGGGGPGVPGGEGGPAGVGGNNGSGVPPHSSPGGSGGTGSPGTGSPGVAAPGIGDPANPITAGPPSGLHNPGRQPGSTPVSPGFGDNGNPGTDLSGARPPGATPPGGNGLPLPTAPSAPVTPGSGPGSAGPGVITPGLPGPTDFGPGPGDLGLPGGTAIGLPRGGYSAKSGTSPWAGGLEGNVVQENGRVQNGVIGRGRLGPAASAQAGALDEAATARNGAAALGPMTGTGGAAQRDRERQRRSWAGEDPDLWTDDIETTPGVLGAPSQPAEEGRRAP